MLDAKKITFNSIKLVIIEIAYGLILTLINVSRQVLDTIMSQSGATAEIQRLKGEMPLAVVEILQNHTNSLSLVANGFMLIIVILMVYSVYKYIKNTFTFLVENSPSEN
mgnify:CR=1 FL=1